ncbi:MAG TPA: class I SAM-dependent methyltransferase [Stellaceae bacterium]|nr:class I SAM-dependent methyltransferase [Stellaceae bacterium]
MERGEYDRLAAVEDRMWWFRGLHANLIAAWERNRPPAPRDAAGACRKWRVLDAGCGTGGFLARLKVRAPEATAFGLERDFAACVLAQAKSGCAVVLGSVDALPFPDQSFDAILSADVLCHRGVAERAALGEFHRCLRPGGIVVLNLPAYRWLHAAHDEAVHNRRRFHRQELLTLLAGAGFAAPRATHWNSLLFPLMLVRRKLAQDRRGASEVRLLPAPVERAFSLCLAIERRLVAAGVALPYGGSILATAVRP